MRSVNNTSLFLSQKPFASYCTCQVTQSQIKFLARMRISRKTTSKWTSVLDHVPYLPGVMVDDKTDVGSLIVLVVAHSRSQFLESENHTMKSHNDDIIQQLQMRRLCFSTNSGHGHDVVVRTLQKFQDEQLTPSRVSSAPSPTACIVAHTSSSTHMMPGGARPSISSHTILLLKYSIGFHRIPSCTYSS